jgi:ATP-dependent Lhr-like helicase
MLPPQFTQWFASRGWSPRAHQLALVEHAAKGESVLLVAPTGGGKTLAGFLPSLIDLAGFSDLAAARPGPKRDRKRGLHTL